MARSTPRVRDGMLRARDHRSTHTLVVGSAGWYTWLDQHALFAYEHDGRSFTARKERRRGGQYWYAYRRRRGVLRSAYLGRTPDLTPARLDAVARALDVDPLPSLTPAGESVPMMSSMLLLRSKVTIPPLRADLLRRPHLLERLTLAVQRPLTLITAAAGSGKTTLLVEWLHQLADQPAPLAVAWVSLDESDNDPLRFGLYCVAALQQIDPALVEPVIALSQAPQLPPFDLLVTALLNAVASQPRQILLILDDYHTIDNQAIHNLLNWLIAHSPPQLRLLVASRHEPPLALARLRARGQLAEIRGDDLRLTSAETESFLTSLMGLRLTGASIALLAERTEGWIAGLQLAALALQGRDDPSAFVESFSGGHHYVLDYLIDEVMQRQPEHVQRFLLETSILDRLCVDLCLSLQVDRRSSRAEVRALLDDLQRANLFLVPLDDQGAWYRYHHLFAEALRRRLHETSPEQVQALHQRASHWCAAHDLYPEAIDHALRAGDQQLAAAWIERTAQTLLLRSEVRLLRGWLDALPDEVIVSRPHLCLAHAWVIFLSDYSLDRSRQRVDQVHAWVRAAPRAAVESGECQVLLGQTSVLEAMLALAAGDVRRSTELSIQARDLLPPDAYAWRSVVALNLAQAYMAEGDLAAALRSFEDARSNSQAARAIYPLLAATGNSVFLRIWRGQLSLAYETLQRTRRIAESWRMTRVPAVSMISVSEALLQYQWNDLQAALQNVQEGLALSVAGVDAGVDLLGYELLARIRCAQGDTVAAIRAIDDLEQLLLRRGYHELLADLAPIRVRVQLALGDYAPAIAWAGAFQQQIGASLSHTRTSEYLLLVRVRIAQVRAGSGRALLDEAFDLLDRVLALVRAQGARGIEIEVLLLQALAWREAGALARACEALDLALELAAPERYMRLFLDEGPPLADLLARLRGRSRAPTAYLAALLAACADSSPLHPAGVLHEALTPREREVLRLLASGRSSDEIADELVVALSTVRSHLKHVYAKLGVHHRAAAIARAVALGLVPSTAHQD